jgi:hypothetical protein
LFLGSGAVRIVVIQALKLRRPTLGIDRAS